MREESVSVIVPVYNAQDFLNQCVDSLLAQTWRKLEIILVDDGARDNSPRICDSYAQKDTRIRVIHKSNGGLVSAWMEGVRQSSGGWLMFVDSDDWVDPCMTQELVKRAKGVPGEIVCCNFLIERPGGASPCRHRLAPGIYEGERLEKEVKRSLLGNEERTVSMSRCMKLFSRELIEDNLSYCDRRLRMGEDVGIVLPALCDCRRLVILEDALYYHYYYNPASMVHKYDPSMAEGIRILLPVIRRVFADKGIPNGREQADREAVYLAMLAVKNELRGGRKGYADRIRSFCEEEGLSDSFKRYEIRPKDKANRILAGIMRRPSPLSCAMGSLLFLLYDKWMNMSEKSGNQAD